jgi:PAS domain S-box-containing protein
MNYHHIESKNMNQIPIEKTSLRVLYLEDSPRDIEIIRELLIDAGYDLSVDSTEEKKEFTSLLHRNTYDIILSDFKLPGFDAFEALRISSEICPDVPFICVSGSIGEEIAIELIKQGAVDYVLKDRLIRLPLAIKRAIDEAKGKKIQHHAETALRESEEKHRAIIEMTNTGFVILDREGKVLEANAEYVRLSGHRNFQEIAGRSVLEWTAEEERERNAQEVAKCFEQGFVRNLEIAYVWPNGTRISVEINATMVEEDGKQRILTICRDITERKLTEMALRESEEHYRSLTEHSPVGILATDKNGRISYENPAMRKILGIPAGETSRAMGTELTEMPNIIEAGIAEKIKGVLQGNAFNNVTFPFTSIYGRQTLLTIDGLPIKDTHGQLSGCLFILQDITDRRRAEELLRESEELYRKLITAIPDIIIRTDLEGNIVFVNETGIPALGYPNTERIVGKNIFSLISEKDKMRAQENTRKMLDEYLGAQEYTLISDNGRSADCEVNGDVLRQNNGTPFGMVYIVRDLTEKKKLQAQFLQSQKMEAIGRLAGGVAHDNNNMIGVILGYASLLEKDIPTTDPAVSKVKSIIAAAERSANLTNQLLAFSRQQIIAPVVVRINDELNSLQRMLESLVGEDIKLLMHPMEALWNIRIDPTQFTQIVTNLATNARDAIANTGTITIETMNVKMSEPKATPLGDIASGEYVVLSFSDSGSGMDAATIAQIFEPFFTTKPKGKGTGLGLSTVFGIIKQNNGFINVCSSVDRGTTFTIYFPRCIDESCTLTEKNDQMDLSGTETILVVEDAEELLMLTKRTLEARGYRVLSALAPSEALALCEMHGEGIDLLITDVVLPGMNGRELKECLDAKYPSLQTLFTSGYTSDIVATRGVLEEGVHFLQKPYTPTILLKKVRQIINSSKK